MHKQVLIRPVHQPAQTQAFQEALRSPCDRTSVAIRRAFLNQRRAHAYSVARMARPTGITTNAGPGNTNSATPISRTVAPTTETITRLMILMLSRFEVRKSRLIQCKGVPGCFIWRVRCHHIVRRSQTGSAFGRKARFPWFVATALCRREGRACAERLTQRGGYNRANRYFLAPIVNAFGVKLQGQRVNGQEKALA